MASNPSPESGASLWLSVGRLQSDTARLIEGQTEHRAGLIETNRRMDRLLRHHRRGRRGHRRLGCRPVAQRLTTAWMLPPEIRKPT